MAFRLRKDTRGIERNQHRLDIVYDRIMIRFVIDAPF